MLWAPESLRRIEKWGETCPQKASVRTDPGAAALQTPPPSPGPLRQDHESKAPSLPKTETQRRHQVKAKMGGRGP